jgi:plastocyanin
LTATLLGGRPAVAQRGPSVSGKIVVLDKGNKLATDVGRAVVWLESPRAVRVTPVAAQIVTSDKEFKPRVVVVTVGSTVDFPNSDPFDHNVFSLSQEGLFDLGLYGRGVAKSTRFTRPGIIRVYCNVHAQMSAFVVVRDSPFYAQPGGDGTFTIGPVPPGEYALRAWHERAAELPPQAVQVGASGLSGLELQLDARGYKFVQHLNKFGQPYPTRGRRY